MKKFIYSILLLVIISCDKQNSFFPDEINNNHKKLSQINDTRFFVPKMDTFTQINTTFFTKKDSLSGLYFNETVGNFNRVKDFIVQTNKKNKVDTYPIKFCNLNGMYYFERNEEYEQLTLNFGNDTIISSIIGTYKIDDNKLKENILSIIKSSSYNINYLIDYGKKFNFELDNSKSNFKFKEFNSNSIIYSTEKLVISENPFFVDKIYVNQYKNKNLEELIDSSLNNFSPENYTLEIVEKNNIILSNLPALHYKLKGIAKLNDYNTKKLLSKTIEIDYFFIENRNIQYSIRIDIYENIKNNSLEANKLIKDITFN